MVNAAAIPVSMSMQMFNFLVMDEKNYAILFYANLIFQQQ